LGTEGGEVDARMCITKLKAEVPVSTPEGELFGAEGHGA
jgi:hypothetical protein